MKIEHAKPPNFDSIVKVFPTAVKKGVLFCWGDTIYNPSNVFVPESLIVHETTHSGQQKSIGTQAWWDMYLTSRDFRFIQELEAHQAEFKYVMEHLSRAERRSQAVQIAERLASPLYGNMVSVKRAKQILEDYMKGDL